MKLLLVALSLLSTRAFASACGTYDSAVAEIHDHTSLAMATAFEDLYSFPDVQALVNAPDVASVCLSGIVVGRNLYQYDEVLVLIETRRQNGEALATPMLFQTASIQAHHNVGPKPWLGFARRDFANLVRQNLQSATWSEPTAEAVVISPIALLAEIFAGRPGVIERTASAVLVPDVEPAKSTYLVSRLRIYDTGNPFTSNYLTDVAAVQVDEAGRLRKVAVGGFYAMYTKVGELQQVAQPQESISHLETLRLLGRP